MIKADSKTQKNLLRLQEIDFQLVSMVNKSKNLSERDEIKKLDLILEELQKEAEKIKIENKEKSKKSHEVSSDLEIVKNSIKKIEEREKAAGLGIKEINAFNAEKNIAKKRKSDLEVKQKEFKEEENARNVKLEKLTDLFNKALAKRENFIKTGNKKLAEIRKNHNEILSERNILLTTINKEIVKKYEQNKKENSGIGVAALEKGELKGIPFFVSPDEISKILANEETDCIYEISDPSLLVVKG